MTDSWSYLFALHENWHPAQDDYSEESDPDSGARDPIFTYIVDGEDGEPEAWLPPWFVE